MLLDTDKQDFSQPEASHTTPSPKKQNSSRSARAPGRGHRADQTGPLPAAICQRARPVALLCTPRPHAHTQGSLGNQGRGPALQSLWQPFCPTSSSCVSPSPSLHFLTPRPLPSASWVGLASRDPASPQLPPWQGQSTAQTSVSTELSRDTIFTLDICKLM